jgi:hypothetical protein
MKSLDRNSFEEQTRLVSRYVAGDLSRSERAEFEAWLVASPELAAEVEMERRLRRGIASAARRGWLKRGVPEQPRFRDKHWQFAAAAGIVVAMGLVLSVMVPRKETFPSGPSRVAAGGEHLVASSRNVRLGNVRGVGSIPDVSISLRDAPGALVIEPEVVLLTCEDGAVELECAGGSAPQTPQYAEHSPGVHPDRNRRRARSCRSRCAIPAAWMLATTTSSCAGIRPTTRKWWRGSGFGLRLNSRLSQRRSTSAYGGSSSGNA